MRIVVITFGLACLMGAILAQSVGIGTSTPDPSARLDVWDNQRGILIPRLTTAERNAITTPARSLLIYNTDCDEYQYYIPGTGWVSILTNVTAGSIGTLTAFPATGISASGFTAHWSPVAGATSYEVRVYENCSSSTVVATATFPAGSTSGFVSVSMPCNQARCYEVRATVSPSSSSCGTAAYLLISNRISVVRTNPNPCTTPNTWVRLPDPPATMPTRNNHVSIAHNGFIYVGFGTANYATGCLNDWWRWDPCSGTWTQLASPPVNFGGLPIVFAIGPYIYVGGGGYGCGGPFNAFYRYDPATNTWIPRANLPVPLQGAAGASDGTYGYVACGRTTGGTRTNTLYRYNPSTDSWTTLSTVPPAGVGRWIPSMAYYQGKLYVGGGEIGGFTCRQDFYAYDIATNSWATLPNHPNTHFDAWAVAYNGKIYVTGEHTPCCCTCTNQFRYYNIASNSWAAMPVFPLGNRNDIRPAELNGVLYGGWGHDCDNNFIRDWWAFCP